MTDRPLLSVRNLEKHYPITEGILSRQVGAARAVDGISFDIARGETLGLVGESGCGKSTAASSIVRLEEPTGGQVLFDGGRGEGPRDVTQFDEAELKAFRRDAQMIFQDPSSSLDPRMTVGSSVAESLAVHGMTDRARRREIVENLLEDVGLSAGDYDRYPHEFSGGQKQRIGLARALVLNPELVIADEPVSALDVSVRAEILSLVDRLQERYGLSMLFISHDMSVVRDVCDRVAVMYLGKIVEIGETEEVFSNPQHPYTEALLSAIPTPDPRQRRKGIDLTGKVPSPVDPPSGCRFHTRCHRVIQSDEYDLEQSHWRSLLNFRDEVVAGAVDVEAVRESVDADRDNGGDETAPDAAVEREIRDDFGLPDRLSDDAAERRLGDAFDLLVNGAEAEAGEALASAFVTPCEESTPEFTDHGDGHRSACFLTARDERALERPANVER
ncbi:ATP-binding cassette domain-containing protein [Halogeometricum sp. S1BR25-6]|uniref:ATP-binding cassette domain-containing protein n=1 Tax=Halogeometricum salsisoli TaxID=2950536 RepID=A0ABU2GDD8_9EURY|nr:oligopeptide/dipeptide ABC transporter ATP-binding protein [Halogeometricum sp. S1BR25-6]MDS0298288.1 ATP-binding cassette domain-containing protein [Halogeometricum sp. S1BR25-6]